MCSSLVPLKLSTHVGLLMHTREYKKAISSGPLLLSALTESSLFEYGKREAPLDLSHLKQTGRPILILTDSEDARQLNESDRGSAPLLIVPDGTPRQISRGFRRIPGLENAELVCLPTSDIIASPNDLKNTSCSVPATTGFVKATGYLKATLAIGYLESRDAEAKLNAVLSAVEKQRSRSTQVAENTVEDAPCTSPIKESTLEILYQDEHLIAINKPSGIPVHKGWSNAPRPALQRLRDQIGRHVFPVHRLDQGTSGVLLFATSGEVARELQHLFERNEISKRYLAVCRGNTLEAQTLNYPLLDPDSLTRKSAITVFRRLGTFERYTLIEAVPQTGRTHQIRRHLKHLSHPIVGDVRYGKGEHNRLFRERFDFHRLALHCQALEFTHPRTQTRLNIQAAPSDSLAELLAQLGWTHLI